MLAAQGRARFADIAVSGAFSATRPPARGGKIDFLNRSRLRFDPLLFVVLVHYPFQRTWCDTWGLAAGAGDCLLPTPGKHPCHHRIAQPKSATRTSPI